MNASRRGAAQESPPHACTSATPSWAGLIRARHQARPHLVRQDLVNLLPDCIAVAADEPRHAAVHPREVLAHLDGGSTGSKLVTRAMQRDCRQLHGSTTHTLSASGDGDSVTFYSTAPHGIEHSSASPPQMCDINNGNTSSIAPAYLLLRDVHHAPQGQDDQSRGLLDFLHQRRVIKSRLAQLQTHGVLLSIRVRQHDAFASLNETLLPSPATRTRCSRD